MIRSLALVALIDEYFILKGKKIRVEILMLKNLSGYLDKCKDKPKHADHGSIGVVVLEFGLQITNTCLVSSAFNGTRDEGLFSF